MTPDEIKAAVSAGIAEAFKNPELHCRYRITAEQHEEDHLLMKQFARNVGKINDIKFAVLKWIIIVVLTIIGGWASFGVVHNIQGG
jgi:hypothetical protein